MSRRDDEGRPAASMSVDMMSVDTTVEMIEAQ
jgi:hypothetical protein